MLLVLPLKRNPLAFCPISLFPFSVNLWEVFSVFIISMCSPPVCLWTHSKQGSVSTPPKNCPHQSHRCPQGGYTQWVTFLILILLTDQQLLKIITLSVWHGFVHVTFRTPRLAWFSRLSTGHRRPRLPQALLLVPSHLPTSKHWPPHDSVLRPLLFSVYTTCMVLSSYSRRRELPHVYL